MNEEQGMVGGLVLAGAVVASAVLAAGAELAALVNSGAAIHAPMAVMLRSVFVALAHGSDPRLAWPRGPASQLPGPVAY